MLADPVSVERGRVVDAVNQPGALVDLHCVVTLRGVIDQYIVQYFLRAITQTLCGVNLGVIPCNGIGHGIQLLILQLLQRHVIEIAVLHK